MTFISELIWRSLELSPPLLSWSLPLSGRRKRNSYILHAKKASVPRLFPWGNEERKKRNWKKGQVNKAEGMERFVGFFSGNGPMQASSRVTWLSRTSRSISSALAWRGYVHTSQGYHDNSLSVNVWFEVRNYKNDWDRCRNSFSFFLYL